MTALGAKLNVDSPAKNNCDEGGVTSCLPNNTTNHEPNTPSSILFSLFFVILLMVAWCSIYSEEGNARHTTRRKEEEINVQEGCASCQQHGVISGSAMEDRAAAYRGAWS
jgi:hypothetical protein